MEKINIEVHPDEFDVIHYSLILTRAWFERVIGGHQGYKSDERDDEIRKDAMRKIEGVKQAIEHFDEILKKYNHVPSKNIGGWNDD